jgi:hypothetical protein
MRYIVYALLVCVSSLYASIPTQFTIGDGSILEVPPNFTEFRWIERTRSRGKLVGTTTHENLMIFFAYGQGPVTLENKSTLIREALRVNELQLGEIRDTQSGSTIEHLPVSIVSSELGQRWIGVWSVRKELSGNTIFLLLGPESADFYKHVTLLNDTVDSYREAPFQPTLENDVTTTSVLISIAVVLLNGLVIAVGFRMLIKRGELKLT